MALDSNMAGGRPGLAPGDAAGRIALARGLYRTQHDLEQGAGLLQEAVDIGNEREGAATAAEALAELAANRRHAGELVLAQVLAGRALELAGVAQPAAAARAHLELAMCALRGEDLDGADRHIRHARSISSRADTQLMARIEYAAAKAAYLRSNYVAARAGLRRALDLYRDVDREDTYGQARCLIALGYVDRLCGLLGSAEESLEAGLELGRKHGYTRVVAYAQLDLGHIARQRYEDAEAMWRLHAALLHFWSISDQIGVAHTYGGFTALYRRMRDCGLLQAATNYATAAAKIYAQAGCRREEGLARRRKGECFRDAGRHDEASREFNLALDLLPAYQTHQRSLALAAQAKLLRETEGPAAALGVAIAAKDGIEAVANQFTGGDELAFRERHAWCYAVALYCALQSDQVPQVAALLHKGSFVGAVLKQLPRVAGPLGRLAGEVLECEFALQDSDDEGDAAARLGRLLELWRQLKRRSPEIARTLEREFRFDEPARPGHGVHVLSIDVNRTRQAWVAWEQPDAEPQVYERELSGREQRWLSALADGKDSVLFDARPRKLQRLGKTLLPEALQEELLAGRVSVLRLVPSNGLRRVPFGCLQIEGIALDALTRLVRTTLPGLPPETLRQSPPPPGEPSGDIAEQREAANAVRTAPTATLERMTLLSGSMPERKTEAIPLWLESTFEGCAELQRQLTDSYYGLVEKGCDPATALHTVKAHHRRRCGPACAPAHVGSLIVAGSASAFPHTVPQRLPPLADRSVEARAVGRSTPVSVHYEPLLDLYRVVFDRRGPNDFEVIAPAEDVQMLFDATRLGEVSMITLRGARLRRSKEWRTVAAALLGPTLWDRYLRVSSEEPILREAASVLSEVSIDRDEFASLRGMVWPALHWSGHDPLEGGAELGWVQWPYAKLPAVRSAVVVVPRRAATGTGSERWGNFALPASIAGGSADDSIIGHVAFSESGVRVHFDDSSIAAHLRLEVCSPQAGTAKARIRGDELVASLQPGDASERRALTLCLTFSLHRALSAS